MAGLSARRSSVREKYLQYAGGAESPQEHSRPRSQGDVVMKYFMINARSYTQAEKARLFLARNGIKSTVERTTGRGGCSFSLKIYGDRQEVCPLLARIGVSCDIPR